ncbi:MAG: 16S rRNA (uracil(1498)-N(3))-methyltransferase [Archangium sp.]|nr:16S rRNA (uracil(1498)-N(3))-methyltransferase [Archangium sp.]
MNLLLLEPHEVDAQGEARLEGRRLEHVRSVLKLAVDDSLRVGVVGGLMGEARVLAIDERVLHLRCTLTDAPPPRANVSLILAIPRPKQLKRVIPAIASLGVDRVMLVNAARVEKSYFDSKVLNDAFLDELVQLGLEQACDTVKPVITLRERLKPFVEDELETWIPKDAVRLLPHPTGAAPLKPVAASRHVALAIGPDGGWVPYEVELFSRFGFMAVSLGRRVLRGEVAVPAVLGAVRAVS